MTILLTLLAIPSYLFIGFLIDFFAIRKNAYPFKNPESQPIFLRALGQVILTPLEAVVEVIKDLVEFFEYLLRKVTKD